ncbi:DUF4214 domain-containing protein [Thiorhodococcus minor]|uniref:DUF4214 domain-containing protein n=1 Tax=Thiorhodococcus minor TaxID=57489 RepID=A0A6M0JWV8_9GAMM|nr:DUF4214 domain-containing protein [Thiorhodococcus minor]NEV61103.1 DUF4214 domain-containing protein [Thiorhodococcus minor]
MRQPSTIVTQYLIAAIGLLCVGAQLTALAQTGAQRLQPADLIYQGAFAVSGDDWAYGGQAVTYYPNGDAAGSEDGYPGSLYLAGNATQNLVGEIAIPAPLISDDFTALPAASVLRPLTDITGGWIDNCTYHPECIYRVVDGLAYLANVERIAWNLNDWYNTAGYDQDSLGWSDLDLSGAAGVWHIGPRGNEVFHNAKTADYLFSAPSAFAASNLSGRTLIAGNHREAGAFGGSQGPTLVAVAPWQDGSPPAASQELAAQSLLYYREHYDCVWLGEERINPMPTAGECDFPSYRAADRWDGGAWVESGERAAVLLFGTKALGANCYDTAEACGGDPCRESRGYHAYPYQAQILLYDPEDLRASTSGERDPWSVLPYAIVDASSRVLGDASCNGLGDVAYDAERQRLYVAEQIAGPSGETVIHVWDVAQRPARGHAWQVAEIYIATMGYAPDNQGLEYWVGELDAGIGWTATTVAQSFFDQPLVQEQYPETLGHSPLITALYQNIFGRDPDDAGREYWLAELAANRVLRNQMIISLINGGWANIEAAEDMARFSNRVEVALEFAAYQSTQGITYSSLDEAGQLRLRHAGAEVLSGVTADTATRDAAIASIPGLLAGLVGD